MDRTAKRQEQRAQRQPGEFSLHVFLWRYLLGRFSTRPFSLNNLVRSRQHVGRYREIDLFGCLQIDDELELFRLFDRKISWLCAFENLIDVTSGAPVQFRIVHAVSHKPAGLYICSPAVYHGEPAFCREFCEVWSQRIGDRTRDHHKDRFSTPPACGMECSLTILGTQNV